MARSAAMSHKMSFVRTHN